MPARPTPRTTVSARLAPPAVGLGLGEVGGVELGPRLAAGLLGRLPLFPLVLGAHRVALRFTERRPPARSGQAREPRARRTAGEVLIRKARRSSLL